MASTGLGLVRFSGAHGSGNQHHPFYIGAHAGWGWGHDPGISSNGFVGGGQFGYNHQWGAWLGGLELDTSGANVKGTANAPVVTPPSVTNSVGQSDNFHLLVPLRYDRRPPYWM